MSKYEEGLTREEVIDRIKGLRAESSYTVNYDPRTKKYNYWYGEEPYYTYEEEIELAGKQVLELRKENTQLKAQNYEDSQKVKEYELLIKSLKGELSRLDKGNKQTKYSYRDKRKKNRDNKPRGKFVDKSKHNI